MQEDLADIQEFMRQAGVRAVAEAVRAYNGELVAYQDQLPRSRSVHELLAARGMRQVAAAELHSDDETPWYRCRSARLTAVVLAVLVPLGLVVWVLLTSVVTAVVAFLAVVLLCLILGGRRGGSQFSGTFTGRMH